MDICNFIDKNNNVLGYVSLKDTNKLFIYGTICDNFSEKLDENDICLTDVRNMINSINHDIIEVHINSYGGSVFAGLGIYNLLKNHSANIIVYIDSVACSSASIIACAGDKVYMYKNSHFMVHKPYCTVLGGTDTDFDKTSNLLKDVYSQMIEIYTSKLKVNDIEKLKDMVNKETWLNGIDATNIFDFELLDSISTAVACVDINVAIPITNKAFLTNLDKKQAILNDIDNMFF